MSITFRNFLTKIEFCVFDTIYGNYKREAKYIKNGISWITSKISFSDVDADPYKIYIIREKDKKTFTDWLIEYDKIYSSGKVRCIPRGPVKRKNKVKGIPGYFTIHMNIKKL